MHKKWLAIAFVLLLLLLCASCGNRQSYRWIKFSLTKYSAERQIVSSHFELDVPDEVYGIAIGRQDINSDGEKDIITVFSSRGFSGLRFNSVVCAFVKNAEGYAYIPMVPTFVDLTDIKGQKKIGVRADLDSPWMEWMIGAERYRWDGTQYEKNN